MADSAFEKQKARTPTIRVLHEVSICTTTEATERQHRQKIPHLGTAALWNASSMYNTDGMCNTNTARGMWPQNSGSSDGNRAASTIHIPIPIPVIFELGPKNTKTL